MTAESSTVRRPVRRALKWLAGGIALLVIAMAAAAAIGLVALNHWLKTGDVKQVVERRLTSMIGGSVSLQSITADLTEGVTVEGLRLSAPGGIDVTIPRLEVSFDLTQLIDMRLDVGRINVERPKIVIRLGGRPEPGPTKKRAAAAPPATASEAFAIPVLPVPVSLGSLRISGLSVEYRAGTTTAVIDGVNLTGAAVADSSGVRGDLSIEAAGNAGLAFSGGGVSVTGRPKLKIDLSLDETGAARLDGFAELFAESIEAPLNVEPGFMRIEFGAESSLTGIPAGTASVDVSLYGESALIAKGAWTVKDGRLEYEVNVRRLYADIARLVSMAGLDGVHATGTVNMAPLAVKGVVPLDARRHARHVISGVGGVSLKSFTGFDVSAPKGAAMRVALSGLTIGGPAISGKAVVNVTAPSLEAAGATLDGAVVSLELAPTGPASGKVNFSVFAKHIRRGDIALGGVAVNGSFHGAAAGDIERFTADVSAPNETRIKLSGAAKGFGKDKVSLVVDVSFPLGPWMNFPLMPPVPFNVAAGTVRVTLNADGRMGGDFMSPEMTLSSRIELKDFAGSADALGGTLAATRARLNVSAKLRPDMTLSDVTANLKANASALDLKGAFTSGPVDVTAAVSSTVQPGGPVTVSLNVSSGKVTPYAGEGQSPEPFAFSVKASGKADPKRGQYELAAADVAAGKIAAVRAKGSVDMEKRTFDADINVDHADLGALLALAPEALRRMTPFDSLAGVVKGSVKGGGVAPRPGDALAYPLPFSTEVSISLKDGMVKIKKYGIEADGVNADIEAGVSGESAWAGGGVKVTRGVFTKALGDTVVDPSVEFDVHLVDKDTLSVERIVVEAPRLGFIKAIEGTVAGLDLPTLPARLAKPASLLNDLAVSLEVYSSVSLEKSQRFVAGLDVSGEVETFLSFKAVPGREVSISGEGEFKNVSVARGGKDLVRNLSGSFPFTKTLAINMDGAGEQKDNDDSAVKGVRETTFFEDLRGQSSYRDNFSVELIQAGPAQLKETGFDLFFKETRFGVDYFRTRLLGGGLTGSLRISAAEEGYTFRTTEVFAGVNLGELLRRDLGLSGREAEIDGDMTMALTLKPQEAGEEIDIAKIDFSVHLSRIGARALDRLLLFLDPKESSPSIMNARMVLQYAKPTRVDLTARHGNLSLSIDVKYNPLLGGQTVTMPVVRRFPINSLVNFGAIRENMKKLKAVSGVMRVVAATRLELDEEGGVSLR